MISKEVKDYHRQIDGDAVLKLYNQLAVKFDDLPVEPRGRKINMKGNYNEQQHIDSATCTQ